MMKAQNAYLTRRLRLAGGLIIAGLVVQLGSLFWNHPLSFIAFVLLGSLVSAAGIVTYLYAIVSLPDGKEDEMSKTANMP
jgi:uncharacterized membrane protein